MNLIFDLDGTLTDPELGVTRCIVYALERLGAAAPERAELRKYIGPALREVFGELLATSDPELIERAVALYRERFGKVGLYENELYSGTAESLARLAGSGHRLFVATAKAEAYALRIIEHFGLAPPTSLRSMAPRCLERGRIRPNCSNGSWRRNELNRRNR